MKAKVIDKLTEGMEAFTEVVVPEMVKYAGKTIEVELESDYGPYYRQIGDEDWLWHESWIYLLDEQNEQGPKELVKCILGVLLMIALFVPLIVGSLLGAFDSLPLLITTLVVFVVWVAVWCWVVNIVGTRMNRNIRGE